jgi:hypothetical protein
VAAVVADPLLRVQRSLKEWVVNVTVPGTRRNSQYPPVTQIVVTLAGEFPAVPALALFRAVGKARRVVDQRGTLHADPDEIERLAREELHRWRPAPGRPARTQVPTKAAWRYGG